MMCEGNTFWNPVNCQNLLCAWNYNGTCDEPCEEITSENSDSMPLVRFTKLTSLVRSHHKIQTMRKPRKRPLKEGDNLHVYVQEKLGNAKIISLRRITLRDITLEEAQDDGFDSIEECQKCLMEMHKCTLDEVFDIIRFDPEWEPQGVVELY